MNSLLKKNWISPFIGLSFFIVAITGLLMFLHVHNHAIKSLHEWIGMLFIVAGVCHLIINWPVFLSYFRKKQGAVAVLVVVFFSIVLTFSGLVTNHDYRLRSDRKSSHFYHRR